MSSIIKVNTYQDANGNALFSSDGSGNVTTNNLLKPAFFAKATSNQTTSSSSYIKISLDTEVLDTNNAFDNTTNYRFTVPSGQGGKYFFFSQVNAGGAIQTNDYVFSLIYKNGSELNNTRSLESCESAGRVTSVNSTIVDDASAGDYYELYFYTDLRSMNTVAQYGVYFGGYKLIGA